MTALCDRDPLVIEEELDEDVGEIGSSLDEFYQQHVRDGDDVPAEVEDALQTIFGDLPAAVDPSAQAQRPAALLIRRPEHTLGAEVFRWTAYFPEHTRLLLRRLAERAEALHLLYPAERELDAVAVLTAFVTTLALNRIQTVFTTMAEALRPLVAAQRHSSRIAVPVVPGELIDRITILEIKSQRLSDPAKQTIVRAQLAVLRRACDEAVVPPESSPR
jgi:hypothetical protein